MNLSARKIINYHGRITDISQREHGRFIDMDLRIPFASGRILI